MIKKSLLLATLSIFSLCDDDILLKNGTAYKDGCRVPHILMESIRLTENPSANPYWIRTNDQKNLNKFYNIVNRFNYKATNDILLIDCMDSQNCQNITGYLVAAGVTNIDLGLFQINYSSYPYELDGYFNKSKAYTKACTIVEEKIINAKRWDWNVLAHYHSKTPSFNEIYKNKLIKNYMRLSSSQSILANNK